MNNMKDTPVRFPCCMYDIGEENWAKSNPKVRKIKSYGKQVCLGDGRVLHENYYENEKTHGERTLVRCEKCGALLINQNTWCDNDNDYERAGSVDHYVPVVSEEAADLLNILMDEEEITGYFSSRLQRYNGNYLWRRGSNPGYHDPETIKYAIRKKYGYVNQELLEKLILEAGQKDRPDGSA